MSETGFPAGTVLVTKVSGTDFREDVLDCTDINAVAITGAQTISGIKSFMDGIVLGSGSLVGSNQLQINSSENTATDITGGSSILELDSEDPNKSDLMYRLSSDIAGAPAILVARSRGTLDAPTPVASGDWNGTILGLAFAGSGTGWGRTASFDIYVDGEVGPGLGTPGRASLSTTSSGSTTPVERLVVDSRGDTHIINGKLNVNSILNSEYIINVYGEDATDIGNNIAIDGVTSGDKGLILSDSGDPKWQNYIYRDELGQYLYWYNYPAETDVLVLSERGNVGINKAYNLPDYYGSCSFNRRGGIKNFSIGAADQSGYQLGDIIYITQSGGCQNEASLEVTSIDGSGAVTAASVISYGSLHRVENNVATSGGSGSGLTIDIDSVQLDDLSFSGVYALTAKLFFKVEIATVGTPDTFDWYTSIDGLTYSTDFGGGSGISITGDYQELAWGIYIKFENTTGHSVGSSWTTIIFSQEPEATLQISPIYFNKLLVTPIYNDASPTYEDRLYDLSNDAVNVVYTPKGNAGAIYFGKYNKFDRMHVTLDTPASGMGALIVEYYNGSSWVAMSGLDSPIDYTAISGNTFERSGVIYFSDPILAGPWELTTPPGITDESYEMYWIRFRVTNLVVTPPKIQSISPTSNSIFSVHKNHLSGWPVFKVDASGRVHVGAAEGYNDSGSLLHVNGSYGTNIETITGSLVLNANYNTLLCKNTEAITLTLPDATLCTGRQYNFKKTSYGSVTLQPSVNGQTIDGQSFLTVTNVGRGYILLSDGEAWNIFVEGTRSNPKYAIVESLYDFPAPINNIISLQEGTTYKIQGKVDTGVNRLLLAEDCAIVGNTSEADVLHYSGSGTFITASGIDVNINSIGIECPTSGSSVFDIDGISTYSGSEIYVDTVAFGATSGCYSLGTVKRVLGFEFDSCDVRNSTNGLTVSGMSRFYFTKNKFGSNAEGMTSLTVSSGSYNTLSIDNNKFELLNNQTSLSIPELSISGGAGILNNYFSPRPGQTGYAALGGGLTHNNVYWQIKSNFGLRDNQIIGLVKFDANTSVTAVSSTATYYKASGTNASAYSSERMNSSTNNRITNLNVIPRTFKILLTGSISAKSNSQTLRVAVYKNGSTKVAEVEVRTITANQSVNFALNDLIDLAQNDYLEVFVRNTTSGADLVLEFMQFLVTD